MADRSRFVVDVDGEVNDHDDLLSVTEAAALLRVDSYTLRRWIWSGRVQVVRVGARRVFVPASEVRRLQER